MYDTLEEIDEALAKLEKKLKDADELVDRGTWGGLLRGSHKKAAVKEQRDNLLRKREKLIEEGVTIDVDLHLYNAIISLSKLKDSMKRFNTEYEEEFLEIFKRLKKLREDLNQ